MMEKALTTVTVASSIFKEKCDFFSSRMKYYLLDTHKKGSMKVLLKSTTSSYQPWTDLAQLPEKCPNSYKFCPTLKRSTVRHSGQSWLVIHWFVQAWAPSSSSLSQTYSFVEKFEKFSNVKIILLNLYLLWVLVVSTLYKKSSIL